MNNMDHVCDGLTSNKRPCNRHGVHDIDTFHFCFQHLAKYERARARHGPRPPERCHHITAGENYCRHPLEAGTKTCDWHAENPPPHIAARRDAAVERARQRHRAMRVIDPIALLGQDFFRNLRDRPLQAFAGDPQNVHRGVVSEQTNKGTEFLLKIKPPETQETEREITLAWMSKPLLRMHDFLTVMTDMHGWFHTVTCRNAGDRLYFRLLRSLVYYIKQSEHKDELWKRLWEECSDSVGMCCEGHISRLCNVLVGFVEGLGPQVSLGELIQQKMAAIAGQDIPEDDKRRLANEFFDQHGVVEGERVAWLDAF